VQSPEVVGGDSVVSGDRPGQLDSVVSDLRDASQQCPAERGESVVFTLHGAITDFV
jgi:hypothetical protein